MLEPSARLGRWPDLTTEAGLGVLGRGIIIAPTARHVRANGSHKRLLYVLTPFHSPALCASPTRSTSALFVAVRISKRFTARTDLEAAADV